MSTNDDDVLPRARFAKVDGGRRVQVDAELLAVPPSRRVDVGPPSSFPSRYVATMGSASCRRMARRLCLR